MSTLLPSVRGKSWIFQVTALCIVLGALLGLSLKTQRQVVNEGMPNRLPALKVAFREAQGENVKLRKDVSFYRARTEDLSQELATGTSSSKTLIRSLNESKLLAGTSVVRGAGVVATITDSPKLNPAESRPEAIEQFLVHAEDLRSVVDELFAAGAEAISINGQRRIATSSIRCVGPVVMVNAVKLAPPYVINAIGNPNDLEKALTMQGGPADDLILLDMITVKKQMVVTIPAYTGSTTFNVARPVQTKTTHRD